MEFWQDSDDPNWSDEREVQFLTALSEWNVANAWRPRDEFDVDVHPESYRGQVLAHYDALDDAVGRIRGHLLGRLLFGLMARLPS